MRGLQDASGGLAADRDPAVPQGLQASQEGAQDPAVFQCLQGQGDAWDPAVLAVPCLETCAARSCHNGYTKCLVHTPFTLSMSY